MQKYKLVHDVLIHTASFLPIQDIRTFTSTMPALAKLQKPSAEARAIMDEDRDPTLNNYADFQVAETKGWKNVLGQLIVNTHVDPQALFIGAWRHDRPKTIAAILAHPNKIDIDPTEMNLSH